MDNDNGRPNQEANMDTKDWRNGLPQESRERIFNQIMDSLKKHSPGYGEKELHILHLDAKRFEEKIFTTATSWPDYLLKISSKIDVMETKSQDIRANPPNQVTNIKVEAKQLDTQRVIVPMPSPKKSLKRHYHQMNNDDGRPNQGTEGYSHWNGLHPETRQMNIDKMVDLLKRHLPDSGQDVLPELHMIAQRFEEKIFNAATSLPDYLLKISSKMHSMETGCQCTKANPPNQVTYIKVEAQQSDTQTVIVPTPSPNISLKRHQHQMDNDNERPNQGTETICHWRDGLHPEIRQINAIKIMNVFKRHIPYPSQEFLHDLQKIAQRFEEKIFTTATSQSDYLRKISLKMFTMETKPQRSMTNNPNQGYFWFSLNN
ncbi:uncharacterized protein LOC106765876 isoform X2 [Vigna radiata var. radiata]|uniref:Uncharacterized protein LOC106765876 isoform X2 n=1 Tax=Vigna radiata var. radiata TaxID=3916 RepID=A0A1S3UJC3_VIGRR|nr:uncharacterized protein LOC106765876 isoform X2 [Vigna radiata var. radiata]